jgi:hypothetical protein
LSQRSQPFPQPASIQPDRVFGPNAIAIILDGEIIHVMLLAARDRDRLGMRIDAVLNELSDGF